MKELIIAAAAISGSAVAAALGGWDAALQTLVMFMGVDYVTGLMLAGVFKKSKKSDSGTLSSRSSFEGLVKKGMQLLIVLIAARLDIIIEIDFVRTAVILAFICNELISITENAALMGIPIPDKLKKAIDVLNGGGKK